jgi:lipid-binding SYLF domain-containing protein
MFKLAIIACVATGAVLAQEVNADKRMQNSAAVVNEMMGMPDKGIPRDLLDRAQCIVIVPGLKKAAFLVGGAYGRGFASCRKHGAGWGSPAAMRIEGGSFGLQLGGQSTDLILLVMNQRGMDKLVSDKFTIGADAAAAAGPVGRDAKANTDVLMKAEMLSYSRSHGLFAGISLEGATLRPDDSENEKLYGRAITNREILMQGVPTPEGAKVLTHALNLSSPHGGESQSADRPPRNK